MVVTAITIISGGQTGADRGALDAAQILGLKSGGWVPRGRRAEDGRIPDKYQRLQEAPDRTYATRTRLNVEDSDGTAIFCQGELQGGSLLTAEIATKSCRPLVVLDFSRLPVQQAAQQLVDFIRSYQISRLNCAGPRASTDPQIARLTKDCLLAAFQIF